MGDDPCECLFNHEAAMRRLLSLLRDAQNFCTDSECLQDGPQTWPDNSIFLWSMLWAALAMALYYFRPNSMRSNPALEKPGGSGNGGPNNDPPPPAPPVL
ncbi:hypothetical protein WR25_20470 [Diploscapter pachys]|uniref:Small integral membrane protein 14 n=1 Tax=Diploscapter pachys TaxID=2018661 RepID=A0A2A2JCA6_9BILA|nr:hypothetical protein WR25_20470 [Diploscapter pachys]